MEHTHHDNGIQYGPEHAQRHIPVTDLEILQDRAGENEEEIPVPGWIAVLVGG